MKLKNRKSPWRGFTLIEMLVVIAIIAVLVSLTAGVVLKILEKGPEVQRRSDISQLSESIAQFKQVFKLDESPPSRFALRSNIKEYSQPANPNPDKLDIESLLFLQKLSGNNSVGLDQNGNPIPLAWAGFDASGNPNLIPSGQRVVLTGDQCLVFFLGGITDGSPPVSQGFSANSRNPTIQGGERRGPFYNFESNRLVQGSNGFYSYMDPYKLPYAYFSSYKTTNGYNRYFSTYNNSDCANLGVWPYYPTAGSGSAPPAKYHNPKSFQIISAGKDNTFGCGTVNSSPWSPGNASREMEDDMSNFYDSALGSK